MGRVDCPHRKSKENTFVGLDNYAKFFRDSQFQAALVNNLIYSALSVALASFKSQYSADYASIMAGTVCSLIPIVIVYACAQKYIVEGVAFAGVKG